MNKFLNGFLIAAFVAVVAAFGQSIGPPPSGGGGSSTPCTVTAATLQYNNSGAFGCVTDWTTGGTSDLTNTQSIGATSTDGLVLQNTTAAGAGAQQWSPRLHLKGQGWKTTATAASQSTDWIFENQPVQGSTNPSSNFVISNSINAGTY